MAERDDIKAKLLAASEATRAMVPTEPLVGAVMGAALEARLASLSEQTAALEPAAALVASVLEACGEVTREDELIQRARPATDDLRPSDGLTGEVMRVLGRDRERRLDPRAALVAAAIAAAAVALMVREQGTFDDQVVQASDWVEVEE